MKPKPAIKQRLFTLIEIIVVLIIISLVSGVFVINIRDLWRQQAFLDESNLLLHQLRLAQDMMQIMDADVEVSFKASDGILTSKILAVSPPPILAQSIADHSELKLRAIGPLLFEDVNGVILENDFVITFFSRGFVMNHGVLKFGPIDAKSPSVEILLPGYPKPLIIQPVNSNTSEISLDEQSRIERITEATRQEINFEKEKKPPESNEEEEPPSEDEDEEK